VKPEKNLFFLERIGTKRHKRIGPQRAPMERQKSKCKQQNENAKSKMKIQPRISYETGASG